MPDDLPRSMPESSLPRIDQWSLFLHEEIPEGIEPMLANVLKLLFSKSISVGNIEKTDMMANASMEWTIYELVISYQLQSAMMFGISYINDWKASMSKDGKLLENMAKQELRYTQDQHVYEHVEAPRKKGWFKR